MKFCLIGARLDYSYSKIIHEKIGSEYDLVELNEEELRSFVKNGKYDGFNVTAPYKEKIISELDRLDELAEKIGAVNTVVKKDGEFLGYNTDLFGMKYSLEKSGVRLKDKRVLILGQGGAGKAARVLAAIEGAKVVCNVSRRGEINFENCYDIDAEIIINATPVGTYPDKGLPVNLEKFNNLKGIMDCVYNPSETPLLIQAKKIGTKVAYGIDMLVVQAVKAEEIWQGKTFDKGYIERLISEIKEEIK